MTKECFFCDEKVASDELTDRHGNHLSCAIEDEGGCYNERGDFLACFECWNPCPYRQCFPAELEHLRGLYGRKKFIMGCTT